MTFFPEVGERVIHDDRKNRNRRKAHIHAQQDIQEEKAEVVADSHKGHLGTPEGTQTQMAEHPGASELSQCSPHCADGETESQRGD